MHTWTAQQEVLPASPGRRITIAAGQNLLSQLEIIRLWCDDGPFRRFFNGVLAGMPFVAFRWELPPVSRNTADQLFECVVIDSPELVRTPEPGVFAAEFVGQRAPHVVGFSNLGNDAFMVVPCPGEPLSAYAHLGAFVRGAPAQQRDRLWQEVGKAMERRLGGEPVWLNTAGAGVAWLHVRLDSRPKYYRHAPYRRPSAS